MKVVNIILNESLNARSFDESNMIHQLEFEKVVSGSAFIPL